MLTEIAVVTLFPEWFDSMKTLGLTGRALADQRVRLRCYNPREHASGVHRSVDDRPYGGGPGMVMRPEPLALAIEQAKSDCGDDCNDDCDDDCDNNRNTNRDIIVSGLSPQGRRLDQRAVEMLAQRERLILVCGRYEGIDERVNDALIDEEWSLGDFVLSGGEYAAAALIDAVVRLQPGVLGHEQSAVEDSFSSQLLDHPHYTRPEIWRDRPVPPVLQSGDHAAIAEWRRQQALLRTLQRRPDLLDQADLNDEERAWLEQQTD